MSGLLKIGFLYSVLLILVGFCGCSTSKKTDVSQEYSNPIISGFSSDPSICRKGDDYYLVNSSFEWFPGLPIYHSKDLVNWELINYGVSDSKTFVIGNGRGRCNDTFAPTIRYHNGLFYLICTAVGGKGGFFVTAKDPKKEWSAPVWIKGAQGIDPSLYWDDDGRCYYTGQCSPVRYSVDGKQQFKKPAWDGQSLIYMQEIDLKKGELIGKKKVLTFGSASNARWIEGSHLFKIKGKYMLMAAEGGTDFYHSTVVFHSDSLWGPYISDHANPVFSNRQLGAAYPVWAVGHTDLVQTQKGDWWAVMHAKRRVDSATILARETCLTPVVFEGDRPVFNPGVGRLSMKSKRPNLPWTPVKKNPSRDEFTSNKLALYWNYLRTPVVKYYNLSDGVLSINCRPKVIEKHDNPSFIARRVLDHKFTASTSMKFNTTKYNEKAGLVIYRSTDSHIQLLKTPKYLELINTSRKNGRNIVAKKAYTKDKVILKITTDRHNKAIFSYSEKGDKFTQIGDSQNLYILSDEAYVRYNGVMIGMYATSGDKESHNKAYFDWFKYDAGIVNN